ncbi:hypothetical protein E2C01_033676 [Portunus trituberculatus]|uniref:Uncharacterized protein n=1 Tax=Portunus trituberculatus TaxID=210409 RepID=A0A5B7EZG2_PORTR|nr:hypothetical protein [Portunus trituberculatus]
MADSEMCGIEPPTLSASSRPSRPFRGPSRQDHEMQVPPVAAGGDRRLVRVGRLRAQLLVVKGRSCSISSWEWCVS